jgi:quinol monooxygenase YgiN
LLRYADQAALDNHFSKDYIKSIIGLFESNPSWLSAPPKLTFTIPTHALSRHAALATARDPYIILATLTYSDSNIMTTSLAKSWLPVVNEAQTEQPRTLAYAVCTEDVARSGETASDKLLRVLEVYASQDAFLVDHRSGQAHKRLMDEEKGNWASEPQIVKLRAVGGFWGREE